jgi:hypothetical protein
MSSRLIYLHEPSAPGPHRDDRGHPRKKSAMSMVEKAFAAAQWTLEIPVKTIELIQRGCHATSEAVWETLMGRKRK